MDCSLPGSSYIHGIFQARILEWVAISFSRRSSQPRDWTQVSRTVGRRFTIWATVNSWTSCYWLCRASPSLGEYSQSDYGIDFLVMSMSRVLSCVVGRRYLLWPVCSFGKTLLAFVLLHFVLQGQTCLLLQVSLDFLILHSNPLWWKEDFFFLC